VDYGRKYLINIKGSHYHSVGILLIRCLKILFGLLRNDKISFLLSLPFFTVRVTLNTRKVVVGSNRKRKSRNPEIRRATAAAFKQRDNVRVAESENIIRQKTVNQNL
jgi:hypothetical protein